MGPRPLLLGRTLTKTTKQMPLYCVTHLYCLNHNQLLRRRYLKVANLNPVVPACLRRGSSSRGISSQLHRHWPAGPNEPCIQPGAPSKMRPVRCSPIISIIDMWGLEHFEKESILSTKNYRDVQNSIIFSINFGVNWICPWGI